MLDKKKPLVSWDVPDKEVFFVGRQPYDTRARGCFKTSGMPDGGQIFLSDKAIGRRNLADFKSNQRSPAEKDTPRRRFDGFKTDSRGCLQTQAIQTRMAASRVTAKNRQARFSYLVAKRR